MLFYSNKAAGLALLFTLAVITRLVFINIHGGFSAFNAGDTITYLARAKSLLSGNITSFSTLGFTLYLALIFKLFGYPSLLIIKIANILLGSLTVLVIFALAKRFYNKETGMLAALICVFHINLLFWTGYILTETIFLLFLSLSLWCFFRFLDDRKLSSMFVAFTMLALSGLIRSIAFLLFIPAGIWVLFISFKQRLVRCFLIIIPLLILLAVPWLITSNFLSRQVNTTNWKIDTIDGEILKGLLWNESGRATSGVDMRPELLSLKIRQYAGNPYEYTKLMLRKLKVYWWLFTPEMSFGHKVINTLFLGPLYLLAVLGLIFSRPVRAKTIFLVSFICVFTLASMIGVVDYDLRYHLPVEILMNIFSAYGAIILLAKIRKKCVTWQNLLIATDI